MTQQVLDDLIPVVCGVDDGNDSGSGTQQEVDTAEDLRDYVTEMTTTNTRPTHHHGVTFEAEEESQEASPSQPQPPLPQAASASASTAVPLSDGNNENENELDQEEEDTEGGPDDFDADADHKSLRTFGDGNTSSESNLSSTINSDNHNNEQHLYCRQQRCSVLMNREQVGQVVMEQQQHQQQALVVHTADSLHDLNHNHNDGRIPFYAPPMQRQKWGEEQVLPHINWGDLFFDLFYVGAAYNLGSFLISVVGDSNGTPNIWPRGIVYYIGMFGSLFFVWSKKLQFDAKFTVVDYVHRLTETLRVCFLALSIMHVESMDTMRNPTKVNTFNFILGLTLEQWSTVLSQFEIYVKGVGVNKACRIEAGRMLVMSQLPQLFLYSAALAVAGYSHFPPGDGDGGDNYYDKSSSSSLSSEDKHYLRFLAGDSSSAASASTSTTDFSIADVPYLLIFLGYFVNQLVIFLYIHFFLPPNGRHKAVMTPMNVDFTIHRYGEWTMLMLGESVLSLLIVETVNTSDYYVVAFVGIVSVILLQALHFESEPSHADGHAMRRDKTAGLLFYYALQMYSMALVAVGASYKVMLQIVYYTYSHNNNSSAATSSSEYSDGDGAAHFEDGYGNSNNYTNTTGDVVAAAADDAAHRARYLAMYHRFLASGGSAINDSFEIKQIAANMFALSLMVVLISLELMSFSHKGMQRNYERCRAVGDARHAWRRVVCWLYVLLKLALIVLTGTLSLWGSLVEPHYIVVAGMVVIFAVILLRVAGWELFNNKQGYCNVTEQANN
jgi:hypothetical protein